MKEKHKCEKGIFRASRWHHYPCGKNAKYEEGGRWYCGHHAPSKVAAKLAKQEVELKREAALKNIWQQDKRKARVERVAEAIGWGRDDDLTDIEFAIGLLEAFDDFTFPGFDEWLKDNQHRVTDD